METTARNRTIGGIVIGAIILILLLVLFSCTVNSDPESSPKKDPTTGESSLPSDPDTIEPDDKPSEKDSDDPEIVDDDIVPAANTGVTFIPAGNVPSGSTPTCELDPSACEDTRPPGAGVDICEIRPDLSQCQEPEPPTTPPGDGEPTTPPDDGDDDCLLPLGLLCPEDPGPEDPGPGDPEEDENAPDAVTVNPCVVNSNTSVTIDWSEAKDKSGIKHYTVTSRPNAGDPGETDRTSATFNDLRAGETYTFSVTATDKADNESEPSNEVDCVMDVTAPQIPQDLTVEEGDPSDSTLNVSWSESQDNTDGVGDVSYNLYRNGELLTALNDTSFEDTGLKAGTEYTYSVQAVDGAGNESRRSDEVSGTTTKIAPTVPTGLDATGEGPLGFTLTWNPSTDEDGLTPSAEIDYRVAVNGGVCFGGTANNETTFQVNCVLLWDTTRVTVTAIDGDGNESAPSRALTVNSDGSEAQPLKGNTALRSNTPGEDKSDAPGDGPVPSDAPDVKAPDVAPVEKPTEEDAPLLPGLDDILPGGEDSAEAPAEEPAEPEATPSESESPAARPTTEEPADEATEDAPAEEDEGGLLGDIVDSVTSAVAAVF
ncbi:fibronectin type III domain-containing protein [Nocardioides sp. NPDC057767]|uniref:fibronectin type III domain-containing protein n=1 Tax=unclassified Nocardioides TaxID=2615069 RepID=UPI00367021C8